MIEDVFLSSFKKHVLNHHPRDILSLDEFFKLRTEVVKEQDGLLGREGDDALPPGDELPPGIEPSTDKVEKLISQFKLIYVIKHLSLKACSKNKLVKFHCTMKSC